jgi:hypothetical protein
MTSKIDTGKLAAGSLLAALVMAICDWLSNNYVMADDWERVARLRNVDTTAMTSNAEFAVLIVSNVLLGFLLVFTYAAIRPRFGRGPATAVVASFIVFLPQAIYMATLAGSFFTWNVFIRSGALLLVGTLAAGLSGAWIYSEPTDDPD